MLLLDTHVALWTWEDAGRVGRTTKNAINRAWEDGSGVGISAIVYWEISILRQRGRITFEEDLRTWRAEQLGAGLIELGIDGDVGILSNELDMPQRDPADRFIVATAIVHGCTLVTADTKILEWDHELKTIDAVK